MHAGRNNLRARRDGRFDDGLDLLLALGAAIDAPNQGRRELQIVRRELFVRPHLVLTAAEAGIAHPQFQLAEAGMISALAGGVAPAIEKLVVR